MVLDRGGEFGGLGEQALGHRVADHREGARLLVGVVRALPDPHRRRPAGRAGKAGGRTHPAEQEREVALEAEHGGRHRRVPGLGGPLCGPVEPPPRLLGVTGAGVQPPEELRPLGGDVDEREPYRAAGVDDKALDGAELGGDRCEQRTGPDGVLRPALRGEDLRERVHHRPIEAGRTAYGEHEAFLVVRSEPAVGRVVRHSPPAVGRDEGDRLSVRPQGRVDALGQVRGGAFPPIEDLGQIPGVVIDLLCEPTQGDPTLTHEGTRTLAEGLHPPALPDAGVALRPLPMRGQRSTAPP
ncbi:hypothetical protein GCM10010106_39720 [Thermopolyspora flexuosa]|nr:hypothetical protein GCM10010106_39720 [Thermopolyspora flexuosa]